MELERLSVECGTQLLIYLGIQPRFAVSYLQSQVTLELIKLVDEVRNQRLVSSFSPELDQ
jgi:hypothetical protein